MNTLKDNILTIPLPNSNIVLTRYLYLKDEVKLSLLINILNKREDSVFWAYELYYSGFKIELIELIWTIYYDFFATLNPSYESYLMKKQKDLLNNTNNDSETETEPIISGIIQDLCKREYNTDVFMMRHISQLFDLPLNYEIPKTFEELIELFDTWITDKNYFEICSFIMVHNTTFSEYEILFVQNANSRTLNGYKKVIQNIKTISKKISSKTILLSKVLSIIKPNANSKRTYIKSDLHDIMMYDTLTINDDIPTYRILQHACICGIDDLKHLQLFTLQRPKNPCDIRKIYNEKWLYHASFSPIWSKRIQDYRGYIDYTKQEVLFINEEYKEAFEEHYDYEPDEQTKTVKKNALELSCNNDDGMNNWKHFIDKYGILNILQSTTITDYLEELSEEKLIYN
jgi:hypothetical protein